MKLSITKKVDQQIDVEIELPAYRKNNVWIMRMSASGLIVKVGSNMVCKSKSDDYFYDSDVADFVAGNEIYAEEFDARLRLVVESFEVPESETI